VVVEAFLEGEEASLFALTDGVTVVPFGRVAIRPCVAPPAVRYTV